MAITYSQVKTSHDFNTVSPSTTPTMTIAAGDIVVVAFVMTDARGPGNLSISNSGTAMTWTAIGDLGDRIGAWWAKAGETENRTASVAFDSGDDGQHCVYGIVHTGAHQTDPVPSGKVYSGTAASSVSQSITPTASGSALWGIFHNRASVASSFTAGTN